MNQSKPLFEKNNCYKYLHMYTYYLWAATLCCNTVILVSTSFVNVMIIIDVLNLTFVDAPNSKMCNYTHITRANNERVIPV